MNVMEQSKRARAVLKEIAESIPEAVGQVYRDEGLAVSVVFVLSLPLSVPVAAVFYYSIDREQRELLEESEGFAQ